MRSWRLIKDNGGQRTFLTFFKKDRFLDLMIINFENASSHKYVVHKASHKYVVHSLWMARSEMTGYSFLVLILLLSQFFKPLLGRTRSRGKCWAAIRLSNRPGRMGAKPLKIFLSTLEKCVGPTLVTGLGITHQARIQLGTPGGEELSARGPNFLNYVQ